MLIRFCGAQLGSLTTIYTYVNFFFFFRRFSGLWILIIWPNVDQFGVEVRQTPNSVHIKFGGAQLGSLATIYTFVDFFFFF